MPYVKQAMPNVSERRICATMSAPSSVRERPTPPRAPRTDEVLAARLQPLIA
jgi:hypothetical protein